MKEKIMKIDEKIYVHLMREDRFKSNLLAAFLLTDLNKETVTKNALIPAVLRRGTEKFKTMKDISIKMDELYGGIFDASTDKVGDKQTIQLYVSTINNNFALNGEDLLSESLEFMYDVIYKPYLENNTFSEEYVTGEKETLRELIKSKINNKGSYATFRCVEETFENDSYGLYKYGREEDLEEIDCSNLFEQYEKLLEESEKHFYISGDVDEEKVKSFFENKFLRDSNDDLKFIEIGECEKSQEVKTKKSELRADVREVRENMDVTQGKLVLAYDVDVDLSKESLYKMTLYNTILGASSNSKLFQNVREKASLAYTTRSTYLKHKGVLLLSAGIELDKYDKALELIEIQVDDMKKGNFSDEDIKDAKVFLKNMFNSVKDDQMTMIELSLGNFVLNYNITMDEMIDSFEKVTKKDIIEVANKVRLVTNYYLCQ